MPRSRHKAKHIGGDKIVALHVKFAIYTLLSLFRVDQGGVPGFAHLILIKKLVRISISLTQVRAHSEGGMDRNLYTGFEYVPEPRARPLGPGNLRPSAPYCLPTPTS